MGMICNYLRVSIAELEEYIRDSSMLEVRIHKGFTEEDENLIDVEKAWNGIFYLLTGEPLTSIEDALPPLRWILDAPQQVDSNQNLGYGPAYFTTANQTSDVATALANITDKDFEKRFDGNKMSDLDIYPNIWAEGDEALEYLKTYFYKLRSFYQKAAEMEQSVIVFIC